MKSKIKYYGFTPLTKKKISGYKFKFKKKHLLIKGYDGWHSVTKIFIENGGENFGEARTTN